MIKRTAKPPKVRKKAIEDAALNQAALHEDPTAKAFGVQVRPKLMQARHQPPAVLPFPCHDQFRKSPERGLLNSCAQKGVV